MSKQTGFKLSESTRKLLKEKAEKKAKELAIEARERMTKEYLNVISDFYSEYEPKYYYRHFNNRFDDEFSLKNSGLGHTFDKYYKNSHNTHFSGGISISTENMYSDYSGSQLDVLSSFLEGYHGPAFMGIESSVHPYNHMLRYKDWLIAEFTDRFKN